jgi:lipopolysaccharide export system protein LptA
VADQLEYDTRSDSVRFIGNAVVRRTRGTQVADEVAGAVIVYDNRTEVFTLEGGSSSPHPTGRARVVMMPRVQPADGAASAPALPLQPSPALPPRKQPS